jgi:hypothetical protein
MNIKLLNNKKYNRLYFRTIAVILLFTAAAKIISCFSHAKILLYYDPIFAIKNKNVLIGTACLELSLAVFFLLCKNISKMSVAMIWLLINFFLYRAGLVWMGVKKPCPCLGNPVDWWPWLARNEAMVLRVFLIYFILVGAILIFLDTFNSHTSRKKFKT